MPAFSNAATIDWYTAIVSAAISREASVKKYQTEVIMSYKLSTFLFDYTSCKEDLLYTSKAIDQGNTEEVYKRVRAIRKTNWQT